MNVLMVLTLASYLFPVEYRNAQFEGRHCYYLCNVSTRLTSILFADYTIIRIRNVFIRSSQKVYRGLQSNNEHI